MRERVLIVDNVYGDTYSIENILTSLPTEEQTEGNYAGVMTIEPYLTKSLCSYLEYVTNNDLTPGTSLHGKIRFTKRDEKALQDIHFDYSPSNNLGWAGVIYLQKNHPKDIEGTIFWRHKESGLESIPRSIEKLQDHGFGSVENLKNFLDKDGCDHSLWEKTFSVPYKYNRLVLFRPWMFHSPGPSFGANKEDSRIVQTLFMNVTNHRTQNLIQID
jgi:hypothetical protein